MQSRWIRGYFHLTCYDIFQVISAISARIEQTHCKQFTDNSYILHYVL